jgi:hypothetical protein
MKSVHLWILCAGPGLMGVGCGEVSPDGGQLAEARQIGVGIETPFDATPSPNADAVFFTGMSREAGGVLFKIGTAAASEPRMLASGFVAPTSLVMSTLGDVVYVSDLGHVDEANPAITGGVFSVPATGGDEPTLIDATAGYSPRGLDLVSEGRAGDVLYFTGRTGAGAGVYRLPLRGGDLEVIYEGPKLREPSGLAVSRTGDVYVIDTVGAGTGGSLVKIGDDSVTELVSGLRVGFPTGAALSMDEGFLLASGIKADTNDAMIYRIDLADPSLDNTEIIDLGIGDNVESAGLHRAHALDHYAWSNSAKAGGVFLIGTKAKRLP